ncbi:hypothetical protein EVAR_89510_1 [Eumeta japonica]|uniref:Uncharacterized protein n=1 Tax=Eumeta variegata TaxID=151549 RepID=A0A4C1Y8C3_EUMVA|nr:hypothetical protein EVAR_89510_1 [Eumeta japonica]
MSHRSRQPVVAHIFSYKRAIAAPMKTCLPRKCYADRIDGISKKGYLLSTRNRRAGLKKIDGCQRSRRDVQRPYHVEICSLCLPFRETGRIVFELKIPITYGLTDDFLCRTTRSVPMRDNIKPSVTDAVYAWATTIVSNPQLAPDKRDTLKVRVSQNLSRLWDVSVLWVSFSFCTILKSRSHPTEPLNICLGYSAPSRSLRPLVTYIISRAGNCSNLRYGECAGVFGGRSDDAVSFWLS